MFIWGRDKRALPDLDCFYLSTSKKARDKGVGGERSARESPSCISLFKCHQDVSWARAKAGSQKFNPGLLHGR